MPQKLMECFRLLLEHLAWIEHQFLSGIRDSRNAGSLWGMMRGVGGVRKSIPQSWLAKCFKGVQEEIPSEEASTLPNRVSGISTRTIHQSTTPSLSQTIWPRWASTQFLNLPIVQSFLRGCRYETIEEMMKEAVTKVIDMLKQQDFHGAFKSYWNGTTNTLQPEEITSKETWVSCVYYQ